MARITVEDCLRILNNRFELVILAAKRARQLMRGTDDPKVPWDNDKATVVALREIAAGYKDFSEKQPDSDEILPEMPITPQSSEISASDHTDSNQ